MITTGLKIHQAIKERGLSQHALGRITGINQSNISKYCNSQAEPSAETLKKIADALGMAPEDLRGEKPRNGKRTGISLRFSQAIIRLLETPNVEVKAVNGGFTFTVPAGRGTILEHYLKRVIRAHRFYVSEAMDADMYQDLVDGLASRYERAAERESWSE